MDLKNAAAVCLISLVSATLVLLVARGLDLQGAKRLEPQLARIAEELEAIRQQGGVASVPTRAAPAARATEDGLYVYYFHGNTRCPTCRSIETQARAAVDDRFDAELERGEVVWQMLNYEGSDGAALAEEFEVLNAVVVLAWKRDAKIVSWRRLDEVWGLYGDPPAFAEMMEEEIRQMLARGPEPSGEAGDESGNAP